MFVRKSQTVELDFGILRCRRLNCHNFSGYEVANADKHTGELEYFQIIMHGEIKQYFRDDFPVKIGLIEFKWRAINQYRH